MKTILLRNVRAVLPDGVRDARLWIRDGRFLAVGPDAAEPRSEGPVEERDGRGRLAWPGLVDLHVHGAGGQVLGLGNPEALPTLSRALARHGVTRFLPTLPPLAPGLLREETARLASSSPRDLEGAAPEGVHLEGPFLNPERAGALSPEMLRAPDPGETEALAEAAGGRLRMMTLSPELDGGLEVVERLAALGTVPAAGHTEASFDRMKEAVDRGLRHVTHVFNAMGRLAHRRPGAGEAALTLDAVSADVICDGMHVHPPTVDILLRCKGLSRTMIVSDATALDAPEGTLELGGRLFEVRYGVVRDTRTGALGGSASSLLDAIRNLRSWFDLPLPDLARLASLHPARLIGRDKRFGSLEAGKEADFFLCDDAWTVQETWVGGRRVYAGDA